MYIILNKDMYRQKYKMKILIITNSKSGNFEKSRILEEHIKDNPDISIISPDDINEVKDIYEKNKNELETIVVAGGDGTINDVINAIGPDYQNINFGIIPLGTGNDLARSLDISFDPVEALNLILNSSPKKIDLIEINTENKTKFCINMSAGGFSGQVDEVLSEDMKKTWGPLAYLIGAITALPDLKDYKTRIICDGSDLEIHDQVLNIVVANGRTVAGGKKVATFSSLEDGLIDLIIVKNDSLLKLSAIAAKLALGVEYTNNDTVIHKRVKEVEIISTPGMWFNSDGELLTKAPIKFSILPKKLSIFTGENYVAYPDNYDIKNVVNNS